MHGGLCQHWQPLEHDSLLCMQWHAHEEQRKALPCAGIAKHLSIAIKLSVLVLLTISGPYSPWSLGLHQGLRHYMISISDMATRA